MRIGVIGAGGVGTTFASLLARAGHDVRLAARGEGPERIRRNGLLLSGAFGEVEARADADELLPAGLDLVLCATQAHDSPAALAANAAAIGDAPVVVLQNGLRGPDTAVRALGRTHDVHGALALFAATGTAPGAARVTTRGPVFVGAGPGWASRASRAVAAVLDGALPTVAVDRFTGAQWTKLLVNHVNALPAITSRSVQDVSRDPGLVRVLARSMRETIAVARASHVRFTALGPLDPVAIRALETQPLDRAVDVARRLGLGFGRVPNPASMLQSVRRGRRTEIDELNGRVVALADALGLPAPVNAELVALVRRVERTGRFVAPGEVVARTAR